MALSNAILSAALIASLSVGARADAQATVRYQVDEAYPPYSYAIDGSPFGFDPYLTNIIFTSDEYTLEYSMDSWDNVYRRVIQGEIDIAGIIAVTEERERQVLFTEPLFHSYISVYTMSDFRKINLTDLKKLRVGVGGGYYTESILRDHLDVTGYISYEDMEDALSDLKDGRIDVIFENQQYMDNVLIRQDSKGSVIAQLTNLYPRPHAYAVSKNRPELVKYMNARIRQLKRNGTFEEIYVKYFYQHSDEYTSARNTQILIGICIFVGVAVVMVVLMLSIIRRLERNLKASMAKLSDANSELYSLAYVNAVTGLPNKNKFMETINQVIRDRPENPMSLIYLDLDDFKEVNDSYGHFLGDYILNTVAGRVSDIKTESVCVFHLGGDEFIFLLEQIEQAAVEQTAEQILSSISKPIVYQGTVFHRTASAGIVHYPAHGTSYDELLKNADVAMYRSKGMQKGSYSVYDVTLGQTLVSRIRMHNSLRNALENGEFLLYYQPQLNLETNRICGAEALIRWNSPEYGLVMPDAFIQLAEDSHLIVPIGDWVLASACAFMQKHRLLLGPDFQMSVNISAIQLFRQDFIGRVAGILGQADVPPEQIELEITESCFLEHTEAVIEKIQNLRAWGIHIALDDFGTGYSSLSYLRELPINTLKIDRSFVSSMFESEKNRALTKAIISLGHSLELDLVAEGVETERHLSFLRELGCDRIQGYYISRPVSEAHLLELLQSPVGCAEPETGAAAGAQL